MLSLQLSLLLFLVASSECAQLPPDTSKFLRTAESLFDGQNELLARLSTRNGPLWLSLANRALLLQHQAYSSGQTRRLRLDLQRRLPTLRRETSACLRDPWSDARLCAFRRLVRNLDLICLVENASAELLRGGLRAFEVGRRRESHIDYQFFCWIAFGNF